ncbi:MAG: response regulator [Dehalococcoidales bacterium]|nr:response regulator [Dehalococcoidales bacterium]
MRRTRILVVDDDHDVRQMLKRTLELEGYDVYTAASGNSALRSLTKHKPDLIMLDIIMPGLDGYQVLDLIRQRSDVPVIMVTGIHQETSLEKTLNIGADDYVTKPFYTKELLARIEAKLRRTKLA